MVKGEGIIRAKYGSKKCYLCCHCHEDKHESKPERPRPPPVITNLSHPPTLPAPPPPMPIRECLIPPLKIGLDFEIQTRPGLLKLNFPSGVSMEIAIPEMNSVRSHLAHITI